MISFVRGGHVILEPGSAGLSRPGQVAFERGVAWGFELD